MTAKFLASRASHHGFFGDSRNRGDDVYEMRIFYTHDYPDSGPGWGTGREIRNTGAPRLFFVYIYL